jgi:tetratricopeptide (TPR) repeat protein
MPRLKQLLSLIEQNPKDSFVLFALAKEYESSGDLEKSLEHYLSLVNIDANYVGAYYHLAKLYETLNQFPKALETYDTGMAIAKKLQDQHAWSELSSAKMNLEMEDLI